MGCVGFFIVVVIVVALGIRLAPVILPLLGYGTLGVVGLALLVITWLWASDRYARWRKRRRVMARARRHGALLPDGTIDHIALHEAERREERARREAALAERVEARTGIRLPPAP